MELGVQDQAGRARKYAEQLAAKDARIADLEAQNDRLAAMLMLTREEVEPGVVVVPNLVRINYQ